MIQKAVQYMQGSVTIRVSGDFSERFFNLCGYHRIHIWKLEYKKGDYELCLSLKDFRKLRPLARKSHAKIKLAGRHGLPFFLQKNKKQKTFFAGIFMGIAIIFLCSGMIWDIHFEGNEIYTNDTLREFLRSKEVFAGMRKSRVDCQGLAKEIRKKYDGIVWVSVSIDGSLLRVYIRENDDLSFTKKIGKSERNRIQTDEKVPPEKPSDMIAAKDGVITHMITRKGIPQVHIGDAVKKGDLLVSGCVEIHNDAKEVIGYSYQHADADIYADTVVYYHDRLPVYYQKKQYEKWKQRFCAYIHMGNMRFSFGSLRHPYTKWESFSSEYACRFGENFYLPVTCGFIHVKAYRTIRKKHENQELKRRLEEKISSFSKELKEKGIQIHQNNVKIHISGNFASANGVLYLNQSVAESVPAQIRTMERNEQDDAIGTEH